MAKTEKGRSGKQIAAENVVLVKNWIEQRNIHRDWNEYAYNNRINRSVLAEELGFSLSVCKQNAAVRKLIEAADAIWFNSEVIDRAAHEAARERAEVKSNRVSSANADLRQRIAELETENRQLRQELGAYRRLQSLVEKGAAGFKL